MTTDLKEYSTEYPSIISAYAFMNKAIEEYKSSVAVNKKYRCEKAFRAATEAVDALLAYHGYIVPVGIANAHLKRSEYLIGLREIQPESKRINEQYSTFKDQLHGLCFYTALDSNIFEKIFNDVNPFLKTIEKIINKD